MTLCFGIVSINLLEGVNHVTTFLTAAVMIRQAQLGLERSGYQELDVRAFLPSLIGSTRIMHILLVSLQTMFDFSEGRLYCKNSGVLVGEHVKFTDQEIVLNYPNNCAGILKIHSPF